MICFLIYQIINGKKVNVLIFPNLDAGNAAYKLLAVAGGAEVVGPILLGVEQPVSVVQQNSSVDAIVHMTSITVADAAHQRAVQPPPQSWGLPFSR